MKPMFNIGDVVEVVASGLQGEVIEVKEDEDLYHVRCRRFEAWYTRPMLKLREAAPDPPTVNELNAELHRELEAQTGQTWEPYHTGGGCHVVETGAHDGERFVWLSRDADWLLGFYADREDEGAVVRLSVRDPEDPKDVALAVNELLKRTIYV
jgi:hypothetical protein